MNALSITLRLFHVLCGVYWAGTIFFFTTYLEPTVRNLGPDGGKVMVKLFERGYLTVLPIIAALTVASGFWMLWIVSGGFEPSWMGSRMGIALSTGGLLATIGLLVGLWVMRPAALRIWAIARELPGVSDEGLRGQRMTEMQALRVRTGMAARVIFTLLFLAVTLMAVARYL